jgi:hypothetical protein
MPKLMPSSVFRLQSFTQNTIEQVFHMMGGNEIN